MATADALVTRGRAWRHWHGVRCTFVGRGEDGHDERLQQLGGDEQVDNHQERRGAMPLVDVREERGRVRKEGLQVRLVPVDDQVVVRGLVHTGTKEAEVGEAHRGDEDRREEHKVNHGAQHLRRGGQEGSAPRGATCDGEKRGQTLAAGAWGAHDGP